MDSQIVGNDKLNKVTYDKTNNSFMVMSLNGKQQFSYIPVLNFPRRLDVNKCGIAYMYKYKSAENSIYQVYDSHEKKRFGWVFPVQALLSAQHDYAENEHFLQYAYVGLWDMLSECSLIEDMDITNDDVTKFLHQEDKIVFVYDKEVCNSIRDFSIDDYVVDLYSNGYVCNGKRNHDYSGQDVFEGRRINLRRISSEVCEREGILHLFKDIFPNEDKSVNRFLAYYQIVEIMIDLVLENEFNILTDAWKDNSVDVFSKKDNLMTIFNEKTRIEKLFGEYSTILNENRSQVKDLCSIFLKEAGKTLDKEDVAQNLYLVRNIIVHNRYKITSEQEELLKKINMWFVCMLVDILCTFKNRKNLV